jgi:hypothetical protein
MSFDTARFTETSDDFVVAEDPVISHPYVFFVKHVPSNVILFMGRFDRSDRVEGHEKLNRYYKDRLG